MDRRRLYASKKSFAESLSSDQSRDLLENTFNFLYKLYESDETSKDDLDEISNEAQSNVSKLSTEVKKVKIPKKNIKLKGKADEIYDKMIDLLHSASLQEAVIMLELISKDNKLKLLLQHGFAGGSDEDKKLDVTISDKNIPVKDLIPTQSEIGINNSLKNIVQGKFILNKDNDKREKTVIIDYNDYFKNPALEVAGPIFVYEGADGNYIIDGHHRWSQIYCMNPDANAYCKVISTSENITDEQILKNFQAAIAADPNRKGLGRKAAGFINLFGADESTLIDAVNKMSEKTAEKIISAVPKNKLRRTVKKINIDDNSDNKKKAKAYLVANASIVSDLSRPSDRKRILMPQVDDSTLSIIDGALAGI